MTKAKDFSGRYRHNNSFCHMIYISSCQCLGQIWKERNELTKALKFCKEAEKLFEEVRKNLDSSINSRRPLFLDLSIDEHKEIMIKLEYPNVDILTKLGQIYKLLDDEKNAFEYKLTAQKKKWKFKIMDVHFVADASDLARYFISKFEFEAASHHLACCSYGITWFETKQSKDSTSDVKKNKQACSALYGLYGLRLLQESSSYLKRMRTKPNKRFSFRGNNLPDKDYQVTDDPEVLNMQKLIKSCLVISFEDANDIFQQSVRHYERAKHLLHGTERNVSMLIIQDCVGLLWKELTYFETDHGRKCELYKQNISVFEIICQKVTLKVQSTRKQDIYVDIAEAYQGLAEAQIAQIRSKKEDENIQAVVHETKKIRSALLCCISNLRAFISIIKGQNGGKLPENFIEGVTIKLFISLYLIAQSVKLLIQNCHAVEYENLALGVQCAHYFIKHFHKYPKLRMVLQDKYEECEECELMFEYVLCRTHFFTKY